MSTAGATLAQPIRTEKGGDDFAALTAGASREIKFLQPAADPVALLEEIKMPHQTPERRMYRPGFNHFMGQMPVIDPTKADQTTQVEMTRAVLQEMREAVLRNLDTMNIPSIGPNEFKRIILAVEEPKRIGGEVHPGAEIVLAMWGPGVTSPVHGHAAGYIHEDMLKGNFDVNLFKLYGDPKNREAIYDRTIEQRKPGIFYTTYVQDIGQEPRSALIHNFRATEPTLSIHYLPEHVRDSSGNGFRVVNTPESGKVPGYIETREHRGGFQVGTEEVRRLSSAEIAQGFDVGDVLLVRSQNVVFLGDHYARITGGLIQKPHGLRHKDETILVPRGEATPLDAYKGSDPLIILKLNDAAKERFERHYGI